MRYVIASEPTFFASYAVCDVFDCDWTTAQRQYNSGTEFESAVRQHVSDTNHRVSVEFVTQIKFRPRDSVPVERGTLAAQGLYDAVGTMAELNAAKEVNVRTSRTIGRGRFSITWDTTTQDDDDDLRLL